MSAFRKTEFAVEGTEKTSFYFDKGKVSRTVSFETARQAVSVKVTIRDRRDHPKRAKVLLQATLPADTDLEATARKYAEEFFTADQLAAFKKERTDADESLRNYLATRDLKRMLGQQ